MWQGAVYPVVSGMRTPPRAAGWRDGDVMTDSRTTLGVELDEPWLPCCRRRRLHAGGSQHCRM